MPEEIIAAAAVLAFAMGAVFPSAPTADGHRQIIAVPVLVDFDNYNPAYEALQNAIDSGLMRSPMVTPNVDAYRALHVAVRLKRIKGNGQLAAVTYSWEGKTISRATYPCSRAQVEQCSKGIVNAAEGASQTVRRSSAWLR